MIVFFMMHETGGRGELTRFVWDLASNTNRSDVTHNRWYNLLSVYLFNTMQAKQQNVIFMSIKEIRLKT